MLFIGIIEKLPHLKNIGVDAAWLSPIFPSPMKDFGYDISDYYNIAKEYGTIADLEKLIAEAKKLGKYHKVTSRKQQHKVGAI